jgi:transcriptional regulator NrdR family protein
MHSHTNCPECGHRDTEVVHTEWYADYVERVRVCNECPTQFVVSYGMPEIVEVDQYD